MGFVGVDLLKRMKLDGLIFVTMHYQMLSLVRGSVLILLIQRAGINYHQNCKNFIEFLSINHTTIDKYGTGVERQIFE